MNTFAAIRTLHTAAVVLGFGGFAYWFAVAADAYRSADGEDARRRGALRDCLTATVCVALAIALVTGAMWLVLQAAEMSGRSAREALDRELLGVVVGTTRSGAVWVFRLIVAIVLVLALLAARRSRSERGRRAAEIACATLAALLLASIAWIGHAAAGTGADYVIGMLADTTHLLAVGAWVGALPFFVLTLQQSRSTRADGLAFAAAARFSRLGIVSVGVLIASGIANAWIETGGLPGLLGTPYGHNLLSKLALLFPMLALAAINRTRYTPRLAGSVSSSDPAMAAMARRRLIRNASFEAALGIAIIAVAAVLGGIEPAVHERAEWPLPFTLSWLSWGEVGATDRTILVAGIFVAATVLVASRIRAVSLLPAGIIAFLVAGFALAWPLARPAFPSSYYASPARFEVSSIARGAALYDAHCARCHGAEGYGDGEDAVRMRIAPADLTKHVLFHREGDLYWWITHGIAGTAMPAFADAIAETGRWDLINFLVAQAEAEGGNRMSAAVEPRVAVTAPDFSFRARGGRQETLVGRPGRTHVLLVLATWPDSMTRLCAIADAKPRLERAGVRPLAIGLSAFPLDAIDDATRARCVDPLRMDGPDEDIATVYTMYRREWSALELSPRPPHLEFLIDREGYLRARWLVDRRGGLPPFDADALANAASRLDREPPHPPLARRHAH